MKKVILSLDVEDWFHLDYFNRAQCFTNNSLLDGLDVYVELLEKLCVPSSFFVLGEIAEKKSDYFKDLARRGYDIGSHGWNHQRPMTMTIESFKNDLLRCFDVMRYVNGNQSFGYRAPCFSLDRERLEIVKNIGFSYDASRIDFGPHPLYGTIDMLGFKKAAEYIYHDNSFFEFETTTLNIFGKNIPISGGGYLRLFPWSIMRRLLCKHICKENIYVFYIHPFELSSRPTPILPKNTPIRNRFRFSFGRKSVKEKIQRLVDLFRSNNYQFTTFSNLRDEFMSS